MLLQPKHKPKTTTNITNSCIVVGQDAKVQDKSLTKNFNVDVKGNHLALYDQSTYAEGSFDRIYQNWRDIWPHIK